jgi:hypothetical protein
MTVAELSGRLSYAELLDWQTYAHEMGPLNMPTRIERAIARAMSGAKPAEIAPWPKPSDEPSTVDQIASFLTGIVSPNKKD